MRRQKGRVRVSFSVDGHDVTVFVDPPQTEAETVVDLSRPEPANTNQSGLWLSPFEQSIIKVLETDEPLQGKEIAARLCVKYTPIFKAFLRNLIEREILAHAHQEGYVLNKITPG